jgi:uncharacterized protein YcfJ
MTRYVVIAVIAVVAASAAASIAFAARSQAAVSVQSADPRIAALQRQVKALQRQVKTLQRRVVADEGQLSLNFEGDTCLGALVADAIQGTWVTIDQLSAATQAGKTYFGSQTPVNDYKNCADLASPDVPRPGIVVPPTINPLRPLLEWLHVPLG